jgi:hypothetical protein
VHVDSVANGSEVLTVSIFMIEMSRMGEKLHIHDHSHILLTSNIRVEVAGTSETSAMLLTYNAQRPMSVMTRRESLK